MRCTTLLVASLGVMVGLGCGAPPDMRDVAGCNVQPPRGVDPTSLGDRQAILDYATQLGFEADTAPTGEHRQLTVKHDTSYVLGPDVSAAPARCSQKNPSAVLHSHGQGDGVNEGRIVARFVARGPYPKLGLPQGTSYLWVDSVTDFDDQTPKRKTARGLIIPANTTASVIRVHVVIEQHGPRFDRRFPVARWIFDPQDDIFWETCVLYGCCRVSGAE